MVSVPSLRERQRELARSQIHAAALELSTEVGFERVTVEEISRRAGVSPRTFFNYFSTKEAAVLASPPVELRGEHADRFGNGPVQEPDVLISELVDALIDQLVQDPPDRAKSELILAVAAASPAVLAALVAQIDAVRFELSGVVARRLPRGHDEQLPDLIASIAMASVRSGLQAWVKDAVAKDSPAAEVRHALKLMSSLLSRQS